MRFLFCKVCARTSNHLGSIDGGVACSISSRSRRMFAAVPKHAHAVTEHFVRKTKANIAKNAQKLREQRSSADLRPRVLEYDAVPELVPPVYAGGRPIRKAQFRLITKRKIKDILQKYCGTNIDWRPLYAAANVLPMRTNTYVVENLIDWDNIPEDPIFQLVFPQPEMLPLDHFNTVHSMVKENRSALDIRHAAKIIRDGMNPHPAGQQTLNVPKVNGIELPGLQHKYRETVLFFPTESQYCHSYCSYCFRWAQFVGDEGLQFASKDAALLHAYLEQNRDVSDVLFTGGDPMVMKSHQLRRYIEPLLFNAKYDHISTIRIGTKSVAYWPYRFVTDDDSDDILKLIEEVNASGKHFAIMAHYTHPNELRTDVAQECIRRLRNAGAEVRCQAPLVAHVNDNADTWAHMWRTQVQLGAIPYYMFVERDTGPKKYFEVPLKRAHDIYKKAIQQVSGVARTVRGPSMSCTPGKCHILGETIISGERVFVLQFLQGRNPDWAFRPFFAQYDDKATWLSDLKPAFGEQSFFFDDELQNIEAGGTSSGQLFDNTSRNAIRPKMRGVAARTGLVN